MKAGLRDLPPQLECETYIRRKNKMRAKVERAHVSSSSATAAKTSVIHKAEGALCVISATQSCREAVYS